ncbi:MAG: phosphoribosylformylglycinamidine cyclo-ligase [Epsilonproteobacteria bacterium]|nr:MAG: phosphoribosylformylglycinamidine cyclo-ligase [Campylobacterota bacterium]
MSNISYKDAGVDIDAGNIFVKNITSLVSSTNTEGVIGGIGSFAGAFELPKTYKNPVLLSATDGVGTKLKLAIKYKKFDTVGIDLVAMCVNDILCNHGKPLFFLDYYATGKLNISEATQVVKGIAEGCRQSQCALIGGETAEMPTMYTDGDFDLAGFCVGIAEKDEIDRKNHINDGDVVLAMPSSGIHSNGFSLVNKIFFDKLNIKQNEKLAGKNIIDILMEPTRIYAKEFLSNKAQIKAMSHITGGGIIENLPRVLPKNLTAVINKNKIKSMPIFDEIALYVNKEEMYRTFNMGVGAIWIVDKNDVQKVLQNTDAYEIGNITKGNLGCKMI